MAEYVEPALSCGGSLFPHHQLGGHERKRKYHSRNEEDDDDLSEDEGPSVRKKLVTEEQMASYLQQLNIAPTHLPPPCPPPYQVASSLHSWLPRQPADYITSGDGMAANRASHSTSDSSSGVYSFTSKDSSLSSWPEDSVFEQDGNSHCDISYSPPRTPNPVKSVSSDFDVARTIPSTDDGHGIGSKEEDGGGDSIMAGLGKRQKPLSLWRSLEVNVEEGSSDSSDGGGGETPERPLSIWIALELQNYKKDNLLPPSIVKEMHKPKGMEIVPWVDPGNVLKSSEGQSGTQDTEMGDQHTALVGGGVLSNHGRLCSMESIEEESEQEDEGYEMEP